MAFETLTPNMNLPAPGVGQTDGPQWAIDLNDCLTLLDQHDHSPGSGVQITPGGIDINSDLTIGNNNLTNIKSARLQIQPAPLSGGSDLTCLYSSGVDLYFNDGDGNQIQITAAGGVAGTPGSITGLASPASATYVSLSETFVWQSDANVAANMDMRSLILRNDSVSSNGITINAPTPLSASYTLTLMGALPASNKILQVNNAGTVTSVLGVDNSTIVIAANNLGVPAGGITATQLADSSVTANKIPDASIAKGKMIAPIGQTTGITATQTYTVPAGVTLLAVQICGGGGGGGGSSNDAGSVPGGGGGNGGTSSFGSNISVSGGNGGKGGAASSTGATVFSAGVNGGGNGGAGDANPKNGTNGISSAGAAGNKGGGGGGGDRADGVNASNGSGFGPGNGGTGYGSGGGGGGSLGSGGGGGGGACANFGVYAVTPGDVITVTIGAGGTAGAAGAIPGGSVGGAGAPGYAIVTVLG